MKDRFVVVTDGVVSISYGPDMTKEHAVRSAYAQYVLKDYHWWEYEKYDQFVRHEDGLVLCGPFYTKEEVDDTRGNGEPTP
jgi:hypothetical protein